MLLETRQCIHNNIAAHWDVAPGCCTWLLKINTLGLVFAAFGMVLWLGFCAMSGC